MYSTQLTLIGWGILIIALSGIVIYLLVLADIYIKNATLIYRQKKIIFLIFTVSLAALAFLWDPAPYYDLYVHFRYLNQIRYSNMTFWEFLTQTNQSQIIGGPYQSMIAFNIYRYIIAKITVNNHWFSGICTIIDYMIFSYITLDWFKKNRISDRWLLPVNILAFSLMPYLMVVSGVRNAFAASLVALELYRRLLGENSIWEYIIVGLIAITFHQAVIVAVIMGLVYPLFKGIRGYIFIFLGTISLTELAKILEMYGTGFLKTLGSTFLFYAVQRQYHGELLSFIADIITIVVFVLVFFTEEMNKEVEKNRKSNLIIVYMIFILTSIVVGSYNVLLRSAYALAPMSALLITPFAKNRNIYGKLLWRILFIGVLCFSSVNIVDSLWKFFAQMF